MSKRAVDEAYGEPEDRRKKKKFHGANATRASVYVSPFGNCAPG